MPMLPMGMSEFADLELEPVSTSSQQQQQQRQEEEEGASSLAKQIKLKNAIRKPKLEFASPTPDHLGVRSNAKFKKAVVIHEPGQNPSWLAMVEPDPAGFLLGQQQQHCDPSSINNNNNSSSMINSSSSSSELQKKAIMANKPDSSSAAAGRKYYPAPYCSCTGTNQQCYRWGNGGWQSACCTTKISMYPLPMNPKKKGSRVAGRKMSAGAFMKLLDRLSAEGMDISASVDLRPHWAKHGTNRYVTIK